MKLLLFAICAGLFMFTACNNNSSDYDSDTLFYSMNDDGDLIRPDGYRKWVYVGTPVTPNDMNNGKAPFPEFHNVYIDPVSFDYWKANGEWRDGTILVKELVSVGSKSAVSGKGYFMGNFIGLEATIKSKDLFPNEPGNWSYFSFTNPTANELMKSAKAFGTADCNSCHESSAADDFVFTQYYPVLAAAKAFGDGNPESAGKTMAASVMGMDDENLWKPTVDTPADFDGDIPVDKDALFAFLQEMEYKKFKSQENSTHPSKGPHTKFGKPVKVFANDIASNSMSAGNNEHPIGTVLVKEMYDDDEVLSGWAAMAKTGDDTDSGKGWFWYEVTSVIDGTKLAANGNGVNGCYDCHNTGKDMVLSDFPLN